MPDKGLLKTLFKKFKINKCVSLIFERQLFYNPKFKTLQFLLRFRYVLKIPRSAFRLSELFGDF
mgnify:CR=1 FL=1